MRGGAKGKLTSCLHLATASEAWKSDLNFGIEGTHRIGVHYGLLGSGTLAYWSSLRILHKPRRIDGMTPDIRCLRLYCILC